MIILDATTKSLEVVLASTITTNQLEYIVSYEEYSDSTQAVTDRAESQGQVSNTSPVTMVSAPSSGSTRVVKTVSVYNKDTTSATVTLQVNSSGTARILTKATLATGDTLGVSCGD